MKLRERSGPVRQPAAPCGATSPQRQPSPRDDRRPLIIEGVPLRLLAEEAKAASAPAGGSETAREADLVLA